MDWPATAKNTISPTPIMRAEAVAEVRLGLRMAFSRARRPVTPNAASGVPSTRLTGPAKLGPSTATPTKIRKAPTPMWGRRLPVAVNSPWYSSARPTTVSSSPASRRALERLDTSTATWRMAAIGATLAARRAGNRAATRVTTTPTTSELITVVVEITGAVEGSPSPARASRSRSPMARPTPATTPNTEATTPTASASPKIEPSTWPRPAPMARSSAISRVRWATMIEKVL